MAKYQRNLVSSSKFYNLRLLRRTFLLPVTNALRYEAKRETDVGGRYVIEVFFSRFEISVNAFLTDLNRVREYKGRTA